MKTITSLAFALIVALAAPAARAADGKLAVVAAENFYGDIARQIGGAEIDVVSIMNNPDQDPHLFETTPGIVRQIADAQIVIVNGANYDPWMEKLLAAAPQPGRIVITAALLVGKKPGDNPHLWYDPATMPAVAKAFAAALSKADAPHALNYAARLATTLTSLERIAQRDVLFADCGHARRERRVALERGHEHCSTLLGQLAIGVRMHVVIGQWQIRAHLITFSGAGEIPAMRRSFSRARLSRDITVPIGTPCTRAISS